MAATLMMPPSSSPVRTRRIGNGIARKATVMSTTVRLLIAMLAVLALNAPLLAHHSVPVNYDSSREITIEGVLTEIRWINPHSRFRLDVTTDDGATEEWLVEMGAHNTMVRAGFKTELFVIGDVVTIIGSPARRSTKGILLRWAVLEDGTELSPSGRTRE